VLWARILKQLEYVPLGAVDVDDDVLEMTLEPEEEAGELDAAELEDGTELEEGSELESDAEVE
jgi:hypothetical protein